MSQLAATLLAGRTDASVGFNVHEVLRVADQLGIERERAVTEFLQCIERDEAATREASLRDIVLLALSYGVSFEGDTLAFLLDLSERLTTKTDAPLVSNTRRITRELNMLAQLLTDVVAGGETDHASVAAQVWRIDAVAAYERALETVYARANSLAAKPRRYGLRYLDDSDLTLIVGLMTAAQDIGQPPRVVTRQVWLTAITGIGSARDVSHEERIFMIELLASHVLEDANVSIAADARPLITSAANGRPVAA